MNNIGLYALISLLRLGNNTYFTMIAMVGIGLYTLIRLLYPCACEAWRRYLCRNDWVRQPILKPSFNNSFISLIQVSSWYSSVGYIIHKNSRIIFWNRQPLNNRASKCSIHSSWVLNVLLQASGTGSNQWVFVGWSCCWWKGHSHDLKYQSL